MQDSTGLTGEQERRSQQVSFGSRWSVTVDGKPIAPAVADKDGQISIDAPIGVEIQVTKASLAQN